VLCAESTSVRRLGSTLKLPEDAPPHVVLEVVSEATMVLILLLRNQQMTDVLCAKSTFVRCLGSALKLPEDAPPHIVLEVVSEATVAHDARAEHTKPAVAMLREEYDWRVRVAMDPDEVWGDDGDDGDIGDVGGLGTREGEASVAPRGPESPASVNTSEEEEELENVIGPGIPEGSNFVKFDNDPCRHHTDFSWLYVRNDLADPGYDYDKTVSITVEKSQPKSMKR